MSAATASRAPLSSFERINYSIRPAKSAERRMMLEAFGRLASFAPLTDYQYVGFGSTFFIDFKLLHRLYGIKRMFSVEKEITKKKRFDFNRPFSCVQMHYGTAGEYLSSAKMDWKRPAIVWLDYDYRLSSDVLADVDRVLTMARPGSLLAVTVDADSGNTGRKRVELIEQELGLGKLPAWVDGKASKLTNWNLAQAYYEIARASIEATVRHARPDCRWQQVFHFHYKDGARMLTFGGVLVEATAEGEKKLKGCRFNELSYYRRGTAGETPFEIRVPNLTAPEIHKISQQLPKLTARDRQKLTRLAIDEQDIRDYQALYRYLPQFIEASA